MNSLAKKTEEMHAEFLRRQATSPAPKKLPKRTPPRVMKNWPENILACPNAFLRCALFGLVAKGKRKQLDKVSINSQTGLTVSVSGEELDQDDCDVWLTLLYLARGTYSDQKIVTSANELVRLTGRKPSTANRQVLDERLRRLCRVSIDIIEHNGVHYTGHLVGEVLGGSNRDAYEISLPPLLFEIFDAGRYTSLERTQREALQSHLARWLHGYYASHTAPIPVKIETIRDLCGSSSTSENSFETQLRRELKQVAEVTDGKYQIRQGKVYWYKEKR